VVVVAPDFPSIGRFKSVVAQQRNARRGVAVNGTGVGGLLRVVPLGTRLNQAGEPPQLKVGRAFKGASPGYGEFIGTVSSFYPDTGRQNVACSDGDKEDLD
jgi:hypothetical protein